MHTQYRESDICTVHMISHVIGDEVQCMLHPFFHSFSLSMHLILTCSVVDLKILLGILVTRWTISPRNRRRSISMHHEHLYLCANLLTFMFLASGRKSESSPLISLSLEVHKKKQPSSSRYRETVKCKPFSFFNNNRFVLNPFLSCLRLCGTSAVHTHPCE